MKKEKFRVEKEYKEILNRYDLKFIYKNKLQVLFILPAREQNYVEELEHAKYMKTMLKIFYFFYKLFGKRTIEYIARTKGIGFLLEGKGGIIHDGDVYLEII